MKTRITAALLFALLCLSSPARAAESTFESAIHNAEKAVAAKNGADARQWVARALERDSKSTRAWDLRAQSAALAGDKDEEVYALHQLLRLARAQKAPAAELTTIEQRVTAADSIAPDLLQLSTSTIVKLWPLAEQYEKDKRPHSAIRIHRQILALDPEYVASKDAIDRLASAPDPSLAADAKPKDLLAGVSEEWIREHDAKHAEWKDRAKLERENYVTHTNSGYSNLVRAAEAMEQMNGFYREFFQYATEDAPGSVPRIELHIFTKRAEYLKLGEGPPVEWSGGHFTGNAVETYIEGGTFEDMTGTLFHEAAHQFVSLATNASGWLNEGLASFFEGCRILQNGTVLMNLPANHRLFPLVARMEKGWMSDHMDGMNKEKLSDSNPPKAPTFHIVIENKYEWGPAWYDPTWGVVYFLYNYQDPVDGRFVYRTAFRTFIDKSGGRQGDSAVKNFEEIVLANPTPPIKGVERPKGAADVALPKNCGQLDEVWKNWLTALAKEQTGQLEVKRPFLAWARNALKAKDTVAAKEHFEKGLVATPNDPELLLDFAAFLAERKGTDRASKLALEAIRLLEAQDPPNDAAVKAAEVRLEKWDPKRKALSTVHKELFATVKSLVQRYQSAERPMMVMDLSWRMGTELNVPDIFSFYADAVRKSGKSLQLWSVAYDEKSLEGWSYTDGDVFTADGAYIQSKFGEYSDSLFDFRMLTLDKATSGDFSLEADVLAEKGKVNFCGLVFGKKSVQSFHALMLFPGKSRAKDDKSGLSDSGFIDLATSYGNAAFKTWRHNAVRTAAQAKDAATSVQGVHKLRIDVSGQLVDAWFDGEFLATQDFGSVDALRGGFGLVTGPGDARFSNIRFMSRAPRDPAAQIEREIRMEAFASDSGGSVDGSWLGRVPPWPKVGRWVQGKRERWNDRGPVPQLLVLWSIPQNNLVKIDAWLGELAKKHTDVGLEFVCLASPNDEKDVDAYLKSHPLPGAVAVDARSGEGIGDTFTQYAVDKFNLPRLLLLDIDGKVVWEGDPGFSSAAPWAEGQETFLDVPLADLIEKRKLKELNAWTKQWNERALPALAAGDVATALPILRQSKGFQKGLTAGVDDARTKLDALENACAAISATAATFTREEADPAIEIVMKWAPLVEKPFDKNTQAALKAVRESKVAKDWQEALKLVDRVKAKAKPADKVTQAQECAAKLETMTGRFTRELLADLKPAIEAGDAAKLNEIATSAAQRPSRWLLTEYMRW